MHCPNTTPTRDNLRYCTIDGALSSFWNISCLPGGFLMAALLTSFFKIDAFWFGLIVAMPGLANALHIFLIPLVVRFLSVRDLAISQGWLNAGLWIGVLVAIAFLPIGSDSTGLFFLISFALLSITLSLISVGWMSWLSDFVPSRIRGRYLSTRTRYCNLATLIYMLVCMGVLEFFGNERSAYLILIGIALLARILSMLNQHLIISPTPSGGAIATTHWFKEITALKKEKSLIKFVLFGTISGFFATFLGTITTLYALNMLAVSPAELTAYSVTAMLTSMFSLKLWGRLIDKHGNAPVLILCFLAWRIGDFSWILIKPETHNWLFPVWAWGGIMASGVFLASFNLLLKLIPKNSRSAGISLNITVTSVAMTFGPILAGSILAHAKTQGWELISTYHISFALALTASLLSLLILVRIREPETSPELNKVNETLRSLRYLAITQASIVFTSPRFLFLQRNKHKKKD